MPYFVFMALAYVLFANSFGNDWTYDDFPVIVNNPDIRSLKGFWENSYRGRPIREITYLFDYLLFELNPSGYHIQNILWHGLNTCLIFALVLRLGGNKAVAWIASLLFIAHPVTVEVVASIGHRKDSLCLAFSLASFLAFIEAFQPSGKKAIWIVLSFALALVAYHAKENALALPFIFIAYKISFLSENNRTRPKIWPYVLMLAAGTAIFFSWYLFMEGRANFLQESRYALGRMNHFGDYSESSYYAMVLKSWAFIFQKLLIPLNLSLEYTYSMPDSWTDPWVLATLSLLILLCPALVFFKKRSRPAFLFLAWFAAFWLPTSNLWPLTNRLVADRYLYAPSVGFCVLVALLVDKILKHATVKYTVVVFLLVGLSVLTWKQNSVWKSPLSLWTHAVKINPESSPALNNLGKVFYEQKKYSKAIPLFHTSAQINPHNASPFFNLGLTYEQMGDRRKAVEYYIAFLRIDSPKHFSRARRLKQHLKSEYGLTISPMDEIKHPAASGRGF